MQSAIISEKVKGASHKVSGKECQDSYEVYVRDNGTVIIAVADGHGSDRCKYSQIGSQKAVKNFINAINKLFDNANNEIIVLEAFAMRGEAEIPKIICKNWQNSVRTHYKGLQKKDSTITEDFDYELYGTTLIGIVITKSFVYAMQIGDGDMVYIGSEGVNYIVETAKILGTETYSLSNKEPWKNANTHLQRFNYEEHLPCMFMLSTDGFANSYVSDSEYKIACKDYFETVMKYGAEEVQKNLKTWLDETSNEGCGDDITVAGVAFYDECAVNNLNLSEESADTISCSDDSSVEDCTVNDDVVDLHEKEIISDISEK